MLLEAGAAGKCLIEVTVMFESQQSINCIVRLKYNTDILYAPCDTINGVL